MSKSFSIPASLQKSASSGDWVVGGVASSFHRDLDGEAITPEAVRRAIPEFMASRGADGIKGGPLRLHHDFWQRFLQRAIASLNLDTETQMGLVAAIALPLGRVTEIRVDSEGTTHWKGLLSQANPISKIIWQMLKEGLLHLGVSLGGKILNTQPGRDALGRMCTLITDIRLDEISITDNPALRLTQDEGSGAYIAALAKAIAPTFENKMSVERFLEKAIGGSATKEFGSGDTSLGRTGMSRRVDSLKTPPKGHGSVKMDGKQPATGMGGEKQPRSPRPRGNAQIKTDVWGMKASEFVRVLGKCAEMRKAEEWSDPDMLKMLTDGAYGLAGLSPNPSDALVNLIHMLQQLTQFGAQLPYMDDYQRQGTVEAMGPELKKALEAFQEKIKPEIEGKTFRPAGSPGIGHLNIAFPKQYV